MNARKAVIAESFNPRGAEDQGRRIAPDVPGAMEKAKQAGGV